MGKQKSVEPEVTLDRVMLAETAKDSELMKSIVTTALREAVNDLVDAHGTDFAIAPKGYGFLVAFWPISVNQVPANEDAGPWVLMRIEASLMADSEYFNGPNASNAATVPGQTNIHDFLP